jgi:hypothetical protein
VGYPFYSGRGGLLGSASTATSAPFFVGDFKVVALSWASKASLGASRFTVWSSNADGFQQQDLATSGSLTTGWSLYSGVNMVGAPNTITFSPAGVRWMRVSVDVAAQSAASFSAISYYGTTY